jgi:allantoinase
MADFHLRSKRVVTTSGVGDAVVSVRAGLIEAVRPADELSSYSGVEDLGDLVLMPGLVDAHVHINEPGRTEWEGFETAGRAAAAGGITTLVDMPLNCHPVTTDTEALRIKMGDAAAKCSVDIGFYGGVVPDNGSELEALCDAGVLGFKAFLCDSGLPDFPAVDADCLRAAMRSIAGRGLPLLVHAELLPDGAEPEPGGDYESYLRSRPEECEVEAAEMLVELCRETGCPVHVVHLSAAASLPVLAAARREELPISVETCPHYLWFSAEEIAEGDTSLKCAPPIRSADNRGRLWEGLESGNIDFIASDHSPCLPRLKRVDLGDFSKAWGGINSLGLTLPIVWTAARERGVSIELLSRWLCSGPAQLVGLGRQKGLLAPGLAADLVAWDPEQEFVVRAAALRQRHTLTPYEGVRLRGMVRRTWLRGREIYRDGQQSHEGGAGAGRLLVR